MEVGIRISVENQRVISYAHLPGAGKCLSYRVESILPVHVRKIGVMFGVNGSGKAGDQQ